MNYCQLTLTVSVCPAKAGHFLSSLKSKNSKPRTLAGQPKRRGTSRLRAREGEREREGQAPLTCAPPSREKQKLFFAKLSALTSWRIIYL
jgi:hypothetical protein